MPVLKCCQNCVNNKYCNHIQKEEWTCYCEDYKYFVPREKFIRADERHKTLDLLTNYLFNKYGNANSIKVKDLLEAISDVYNNK